MTGLENVRKELRELRHQLTDLQIGLRYLNSRVTLLIEEQNEKEVIIG